jgi:carbon starvation protein CstA
MLLNGVLHSDRNHVATTFGGAGAQTGAFNMCLFLLQFSLVVLVTGVLSASPAGFRSKRFDVAEAHKNAWLKMQQHGTSSTSTSIICAASATATGAGLMFRGCRP